MRSNGGLLLVRIVVLVGSISNAACGGAFVNTGSPAPNPNGCYVMVFDQPSFDGTGDVFNRSGRWASLRRLDDTRELNWHDRIRSARTGFAATATFFTAEDFKGESLQLLPSTDRPQFEGRFTAQVGSLEIVCNK
jgi:hypothetical protein